MAENLNYHKNKKFCKISVIFSALTLTILATTCSARVTQTVQPIQPPSQQINQLNTKTPARRVMHPAFQNAGKNPGLEIWRIENFNPVAYPARDFGKFYTGDSYIVLNSKKNKNNQFTYDVHFWLGSETSQDEAGSAAILTVQLDDILNGEPVQHRETQDHESSLFLGYFKDGIRYEQGGVASGFQHVQTNAGGEKRLFQVKGKRNVRVRQVNLSISAMNKGDCFILDAGNEIYVYVGSGAKRVEKLKAISAANQIRDQDHNGRARVNIIDEFSNDFDKAEFFTILGSGSANEVPDESVAEEDGAFERADERAVTLYKVSDQSGSLKVDTISTRPFRQEMLETADCFILDTGSGIYAWVGRGATAQEKTQAVAKAQDFLKTKKYPNWTRVQRIVEGAESAPFKQYFSTWRDVGMQHTRLIRAAMGYDSDIEDSEINFSVLDELKKKGGRAIGFMPDMGQRKIRKIVQFSHHPETNKSISTKFTDIKILSGSSTYAILYDYESKNGDLGSILYCWEGQNASKDSKKSLWNYCKLMPTRYVSPIAVRVVQGNEPRHFLKMFKGQLVSNITDTPTKPQLFKISGTDALDVSAKEVTPYANNLESDNVFVIKTTEKLIIWIGKSSSSCEKDMAEITLRKLWNPKEIEIYTEGDEPNELWDLLDGPRNNEKSDVFNLPPILEPRLYHCKLVNYKLFQIEPIDHFGQNDLDSDDVMILDGGDEIYVWIGKGTSQDEKESAFKMGFKMLEEDVSFRIVDQLPIIRLEQGREPKCFKLLFPTWNDDHWQSVPTYENIKETTEEANRNIDLDN